jgi:hypothetical protein
VIGSRSPKSGSRKRGSTKSEQLKVLFEISMLPTENLLESSLQDLRTASKKRPSFRTHRLESRCGGTMLKSK